MDSFPFLFEDDFDSLNINDFFFSVWGVTER